MRGRTRRILTDLRPYEFGRIEFGRASRELIHPDAGMLCQKLFHFLATMNRMLIPDQNDRSRNDPQQVAQKGNHLLTGDGFPMGLDMQLYLVPCGRDTQSSDQVHALVVIETRANRRGLPAGGPGPFQGRDGRKPAFIEQNQCRPKLLPLFLSAARRSGSSGDLFIIACVTASLRFLATPPHAPEQPPNAARLVAHVKEIPDQVGNPIQRPVVIGPSVDERSELQGAHQSTELCGG